MNPINEILKDARQFLREPRTLLLMVAAPLIVLFIMSAIFSGDSTLPREVPIGICDLDMSNASALFIAGISNHSAVHLYDSSSNCSAVLENDVRIGQQAAGLVIPFGFEEGIRRGVPQNISMFLDNSRLQVSSSIEIFVKAAVQETDQRIGAQFISSVWQQLGTADGKLAQTLTDINATRERAVQMRANLQSTADSFQSLNISGAQAEITAANLTIVSTRAAMDAANNNLTRIASNFADYDASLLETENDLLTLQSGLADIQSSISDAKAAGNCGNSNSAPSNFTTTNSSNSSNSSTFNSSNFFNVSANASSQNASNASSPNTSNSSNAPAFNASTSSFSPYCASIGSLASSVGTQQSAVEGRIQKVRAARAGLTDANLTINDFKASIAEARSGTADAQERISRMSGFVEDLERSRQQSLQTIAGVDLSLQELINKTYEFEDILSASRSQINQITSRAPASIISPMIVSSAHLFGTRSFFQFMLPSVLPLILMFVALFLASTSLVREKNAGTLKRIFIAQVNPFQYAAIKVLSYSIVLLPEALLLALIASLVYGAFPLTDFSAWFFVIEALTLLTITFVAVGVLIAVYSESEATAFLSSLVIGLPLLFMSGILFPIEFMPPPVALISFASPLTQTVLSMQGAMLYHSLQAALSTVLILYDIVLIFFIGLSLRKK